MIPVFVYGTLRKGESNHHLLKGRSMFVSENAVVGNLVDLGPYPAMLEGNGTVFGEVYMVGEQTLADLDKLEGHPTLYARRKVPLKFSMDKYEEAYAYFFVQEIHGIAKKLPDGIWKRNVKYGAA